MWDVWSHITNFIERDYDKCRLMPINDDVQTNIQNEILF